jgi:hypothetical protein
MKLLFYSSDDLEVAQVSKEFSEAGIACELRHEKALRILNEPPCTELWIRHDRDCHRALMLCVQQGVGFARRSTKARRIGSWSEISTGCAPSPESAEEPGEIAEEQEEIHPMHRGRRARAA